MPTILLQLLGDSDPDTARKAIAAMLKMKEIDVEALRRAVV